MTKALITGIKGFAGSHLAELLLAQGYCVAGLDHALDVAPSIEHIRDSLELCECDLRDSGRLNEVVSLTKPDEIYHLAAIAHVPTSYRDVRLTFDVNLNGSLSLFEAVRSADWDIKILYVGSASEYGDVREEEIPIDEDVLLRPVDPYSASKASADLLAYQYFRSFDMHIVRVRPFNHIGPRQSPEYVVSSFAKQIAEIDKSLKAPVMIVGNLEARRDFTDVRDMVRGYWFALQKGEPGEAYNICSGKAISIREVVNRLLKLSEKEIKIEQDVKRLRPADIPLLLGDSAKFRETTGWRLDIRFEKTLKDTLDYWGGRS
ncbi:GDP-mannose 4,6-dehydratase [Candidatus Bipolaricaulota bacterium]